MEKRGILKRRWKRLAFYPLLTVLAGLMGWASVRYSLEFDWTVDGRNTLASSSQNLVQMIAGPIEITAYASKNGELRNKIRNAIDRYRRFKPDLRLRFVDPNEEPDTVRSLGIRADGEMVFQYHDRTETVADLSESVISNALYRLSNAEPRWIVFLSGHGERSSSGVANHDLGQFGKHIQNKGYRILELKTGPGVSIPDNASLLVIADPVVGLLPGESDAILEYVGNGGNLLWLKDSERLNGLNGLKELLSIHFLHGIVVDANAKAYGIDNPSFVTLSEYPAHAITENIDSISLFPKSGALESSPSREFHHQPILQSSQQSWSETGPLKGHIQFNPDQGEKRGPLSLGLAITRARDDREQRILVVGDGDFLSNTYLGNGINLDLGFKMIQWLTEAGDSIAIPVRFRSDQSLQLSPEDTAKLGIVFLIVIPATLIFSGWIIHRRRKRS